MKNTSKKILVALCLTALLNGCSVFVTDSMIEGFHHEMDANHDGYIDYQEFLKTSSYEDDAKEAKKKGMTIKEYQKWDFNRADGNGDGKITSQELIDLARKEL